MVLGEALRAWLTAYALLATITGLGISLIPGRFARKEQVLGALAWPVSVVVFLIGLTRGFLRRQD